MAEVKITQLPGLVGSPSDSSLFPCVVSGVTRKVALDQLKTYMEVPTEFVTLVSGSSPIVTSPVEGIRGEGVVSILPASSTQSGSMSSSHYSMLAESLSSSSTNRLILRDQSGNFEANNITLRAPNVAEASAASGTITGNLNQRRPEDTGVNAKLGSLTRFFANVTALNASETSTFQASLYVNGNSFVGPSSAPTISMTGSNGNSTFSGDMSVLGNITLGAGKQISGAVNMSGSVFTGKFSDLTSGSLSVGNALVVPSSGDVTLNRSLTFDSSRSISLPSGSLSCQTATIGGTISAASFSGPLSGNSSSTNAFNGNRTITIAGAVSGSSLWDGSGNLSITTTAQGGFSGANISDGSVADSKLATISTSGKVSNSATTASSSNLANSIVSRDGNGDFSARVITSSLSGNASTADNFSATGLATARTFSATNNFYSAKGANPVNYSDYALTAYAPAGHGAAMSFHIGGEYAINMGLISGSSGVFALGGWISGNRWTSDASGNFTASGNVTAYSDDRLKKNWKNFDSKFLEKLSKVKYGIFERIDTQKIQVGVSAQSLREVLPEAVMEDIDGKLSVSYGNAALAACVELSKKVLDLEKKLAELSSA